MFWAEQTRLLERVATGHPLNEVLEGIVTLIEQQAEGMHCSLLILQEDGVTFRAGAAPTLPREYSKHLDGLTIGPHAGSCGAAAHSRTRVIVEDIATHSNWVAYRHLALPFGLRACWSTPIFSPTRQVLGTFAMYYGSPRGPSPEEMAWVDAATHLAAIAIDSDRRTKSLRQSEERLRAMIEQTPDVAIQWFDKAGRVIFYNAASRRLFGWSEHDALGKSLLELGFWEVSEEKRFEEARFAALAGEHVPTTRFRYERSDGSDGHLLSTVFRIPLSETEDCTVCMDVDFTEHSRMEATVREGETLRSLLYDSVSDVIFYLAVEGEGEYRFKSVNRAFLEATQLRVDQVVDRRLDDVIPPASLGLVKSKYAEAIASRQRVTWEERSVYPGGTKYGEVSVTPMHDSAGRCTHLLGTVHDTTERRAAEQERKEVAEQLGQDRRLHALGTMAGGIAHDFNNILMAVHSNVDEAMEQLGTGHRASESITEVKRAATRASALVRQILTFGRGSAPGHETVNLQAVIDEAFALSKGALRPSTTVKSAIADDVPTIFGDATQVFQVLANLVTNAAQAIGERPGTITVAAERVVLMPGQRRDAPDAAGVYLRLTVADDGPGMDDKTAQRVFEPFFTTKAPGKGTGLGLSVVHGVMKGHGGVVSVRSELKRGTTFELLFPAAQDTATKVPPSPKPTAGKYGILFVDDDDALILLARRAFARLGHRIAAFGSAKEAVEAYRRAPTEFDVVVSDFNMPHMDGPTLVGELRRIHNGVRVVLTTGCARDSDLLRAKDLGNVPLLEKPQSINDLVKLVELELDARQST